MSLVRFLIILGLGTLLSWSAWVLVIMTIDPFANGAFAVSLFAVSFWLAMVGTLTLIGFFVRYWLEKHNVPFRQLGVAFRQSILMTSAATVALLLQAERLFQWWVGFILVLLIMTIEFFFLSGDARRPQGTIHEPQV